MIQIKLMKESRMDLSGSPQGRVLGFYENGNEHLGAIKAGNLLTTSLSYPILRHSASWLGDKLVNHEISPVLSVMAECFIA
jgi:hypothetical protein